MTTENSPPAGSGSWTLRSTLACGSALLLAALLPSQSVKESEVAAPATVDRARAAIFSLPLTFEENRGQAPADMAFIARGSGYLVGLSRGEVVLSLARRPPSGPDADAAPVGADAPARQARIRMIFVDAAAETRLRGLYPTEEVVHCYFGDRRGCQESIPTFREVIYDDLYRGIDIRFYGRQRELEYDVLVRAGADPGGFGMRFEGVDCLEIAPDGALLLHSPAGTVVQRAPVAWQDIDGKRHPITAGYRMEDGVVRWSLGAYDPAADLVIDPMISYATFLGGSGRDMALSIAVDSQGFAHVTGETAGMGFPSSLSAPFPAPRGGVDAFVARINPLGNMLVWCTYLGGSGDDKGMAIVLDAAGTSYVAGYTSSSDFPASVKSFDASANGGSDAFVARFSPIGTLVSAAYLGGSGDDVAEGIALSPGAPAPVVTGYSRSPDFPTTAAAYNRIHQGGADVFVTKVSADLRAIAFSTYVGGSMDDYASDVELLTGAVPVVTGWTWSAGFPTTPPSPPLAGGCDVFVFRLDALGTSLAGSLLIGGASNDFGRALALEQSGAAFIAGSTQSSNFPVTFGAFDTSLGGGPYGDGFVAKADPVLGRIVYATYLGGSENEAVNDIISDISGVAIVAGNTESPDFPMVNALFPAKSGGYDAFVALLGAKGDFLGFSSFFGSTGNDAGLGLAKDPAGILYIAGYAGGQDFPVTFGAYDSSFNGGAYDALVMRLSIQ